MNGARLTSCAGNYDDGLGTNGALLTVGGVGDSPANPTNALQQPGDGTLPRVTDDELYDLEPFIAQGSSSATINTRNPSGDDNLFLAIISITGQASVGPVVPNPCAPAPTPNPSAGDIVGTSGNDKLVATSGNNRIFGLGGNDEIHALGGNDVVFGGDGNDKIFGGNDNDTLCGEIGIDFISGGARKRHGGRRSRRRRSVGRWRRRHPEGRDRQRSALRWSGNQHQRRGPRHRYLRAAVTSDGHYLLALVDRWQRPRRTGRGALGVADGSNLRRIDLLRPRRAGRPKPSLPSATTAQAW